MLSLVLFYAADRAFVMFKREKHDNKHVRVFDHFDEFENISQDLGITFAFGVSNFPAHDSNY